MTINISSLPTQLIIGSQDWSQHISFSSGIQIGYPEYAMGSGLMIAQGTINLEFRADFAGLPSSPIYKLNPSQWRRGQTIAIAVNGAYLPCSGQELFLLKAPQYPKREINGVATMALSVGCRLALEYFPPEPSKNVSEVTAGVPTNRAMIISRILNYIKVPNALSSIPYAINYSLPKMDGNWLQFAGKIADSAGYYLRCRTDGVVVSEPITLIHGSSSKSYLIGRDEKIWDAIGEVSEQPLELTIVTGIVQDTKPVVNAPTKIKIMEPYGVLFPKVNKDNPYTGLIEKSVTETTTEVISPNSVKKTTEISEAYGLTYPNVNKTNPYIGIVPKGRTTEIYRLRNGIVYESEIEISEAYGLTYPNVNKTNPYIGIVPKSRTKTTWVKIKDGLWDKTTEISEAYGVTYPSVNKENPYIGLAEKSVTTEPDTTGPPTNIGDISENTTSDRQISAKIYATHLAADPYRPRQRTIDLPYAVSEAQLSNYGKLFNQMLTGRAFGWQFGGVLDTSLLPFQQVSVQFENLIYYLRVDALQYAINGREAYLLWNGIEVGTASASTPNEIIYPLQIPLGIFEAVSLSSAIATIIRIELSESLSLSYGTANKSILILNESLSLSYGTARDTMIAFEAQSLSYGTALGISIIGFEAQSLSYGSATIDTSPLTWRTLSKDNWRTLSKDNWRTLRK